MLGTLNIGSLAHHIGPLLLVTLSLIICNIQIKRFSSYVIFCAGIIYLEQKWKSAYLSIMEDESKVLVEFSNGNFRTLYSRDLYGKLILTYNKRRKKKLCAWLQKLYILILFEVSWKCFCFMNLKERVIFPRSMNIQVEEWRSLIMAWPQQFIYICICMYYVCILLFYIL